MYHLQSEKIMKTLWHYEDHRYILRKDGNPEQNAEAPDIET